MEERTTTIGSVNVQVKASLFVDEATFVTCLNLINIYANNNGIKGFVLGFSEDGNTVPEVKRLMTDQEKEMAMYGNYYQQPMMDPVMEDLGLEGEQ